MSRVVVIGGGVFGRAVGREVVHQGGRCTILSPNPVELPLLWRRADAVTGEGLREGLRSATAMVYAAWSNGDAKLQRDVCHVGALHAISAARSAGVGKIAVVGPIGAEREEATEGMRGHRELAEMEPGLLHVRLPMLFGDDDHLTSEWRRGFVKGARVRYLASEQHLRPLATWDAARALLALMEKGTTGVVELTGPVETTTNALALAWAEKRGVTRIRGRRATRWERALLACQSDSKEAWVDLLSEGRVDPEEWVTR